MCHNLRPDWRIYKQCRNYLRILGQIADIKAVDNGKTCKSLGKHAQ